MSEKTLKALRVVGINVLVLAGLVLLLELVGQYIAATRPTYDVLFLEPDRAVGWKQVPNLRWRWAGFFWYASDFSVEIETNPLGFHDVARELPKPPGVTRVAMLGDSFIEAVQVPLSKTAAQVLERRLNASQAGSPGEGQRWEVLNFGISAYGVGQYLLTWEKYASEYNPDHVAILVAGLQMRRTSAKYEYAAGSGVGANGRGLSRFTTSALFGVT